MTVSWEVLNRRLLIGVGNMMDSSRIGSDLVGMAFSLWACQIVPFILVVDLELMSYSYW